VGVLGEVGDADRGVDSDPDALDVQRRVQGDDIRLGRGFASVRAERAGRLYTTTIRVRRVKAALTIGVTLPRGKTVASARLDGRRVKAHAVTTNRGVEVTVRARGGGRHVLAVTRR
jgi:hypothetical protein